MPARNLRNSSSACELATASAISLPTRSAMASFAKLMSRFHRRLRNAKARSPSLPERATTPRRSNSEFARFQPKNGKAKGPRLEENSDLCIDPETDSFERESSQE